jgi:hypothetical protein
MSGSERGVVPCAHDKLVAVVTETEPINLHLASYVADAQ